MRTYKSGNVSVYNRELGLCVKKVEVLNDGTLQLTANIMLADERANRGSKEIKVPIGEEFHCYNFDIFKDNSGFFNEKHFASREDLMIERYNIDIVNVPEHEYTGIDAMLEQIKMWGDSGSPNVEKIKAGDNFVYLVVNDREATLAIGREVTSLVGNMDSNLMNRRNIWYSYSDFIFEKVTVIGGGVYLRDISHMFHGLCAEKIDTEMLDIVNVNRVEALFYAAKIGHLDLSFLNKIQPVIVTRMFAHYVGDNINLSDLDLSQCVYAAYMFESATVFIKGKADTRRVKKMASMFRGYAGMLGDYNKLSEHIDTSGAENMSDMFREATITNIDFRGLKFDSLRTAMNMLFRAYCDEIQLGDFPVEALEAQMHDMLVGIKAKVFRGEGIVVRN